MNLSNYISALADEYSTGQATEHSYRSSLERLFESIWPDVTAINEPKRVACGAPDFAIRINQLDVGHCEVKDVPIDLTNLDANNLAQKQR